MGEASVDAAGMSNVFGVIWPTSSTTSEPFELMEALLPPALLFPDLLAEEDVLLDFPELLVFSDFDPLPDLPDGSGSNFEPLLFEDFLDPLADVFHASASDFEPLLDSVGIHAGDHAGNIVGPQEQGTPFSSAYS